MRVYISGRITGNENYEAEFRRAEQWLKRCNSDVNPITAINPVPVIEPIKDKLSYSETLAVCFKLIDLCDCIYMLKGWQKSKGACAELTYAKATGKLAKYEDKQITFKRTIFNGGSNDYE